MERIPLNSKFAVEEFNDLFFADVKKGKSFRGDPGVFDTNWTLETCFLVETVFLGIGRVSMKRTLCVFFSANVCGT